MKGIDASALAAAIFTLALLLGFRFKDAPRKQDSTVLVIGDDYPKQGGGGIEFQ